MKQYDNNLDASEHYHEIEYGEGGVAKAKEIIMKKIGLNEENADYLVSQSEKFAIWLADSIVKKEVLNLNNQEEQLGRSKTFDKKSTLDFINKRNNYIQYTYSSKIREILDWLQHPVTPKQELKTLSFDEALEKSKQWHDELQVLGGDIDFVEPEKNQILKEYPKDSDGVQYYWVFIPSNYCDLESSRMGHCGRTGYGNTLISLRSVKPYGKGHTLSDSHVTIAYGENGIFYQVKGKKNQKPAEKYQSYIFDLIKEMLTDDFNELKVNRKIKVEKLNSEIDKLDDIGGNLSSELSLIDVNSLEFKEKTDALHLLIHNKTELRKQLKSIPKDLNGFTGFGSEYGDEEDYGFEDMTKEQLRELYEINPTIFNDVESVLAIYDAGIITDLELQTEYKINESHSIFSSFGNQIKLFDRGIIENKPSTIINVSKDCEDASDLLDIDRDTRDDIVEMVLCGDTNELWDNWGYWYENASDLIDNLNKENEQIVINEIARITGLDESVVKENGIAYYLDGEDEEFDKDSFDNIQRALADAQESADQNDYYDYLKGEIESSFENYGKVISLNDEGVEIEFDLLDFMDEQDIIDFMENMETDSLDDVFSEALSDGTINKPSLNLDNRYSADGSREDFNDAFEINNYARGGGVGMKFYVIDAKDGKILSKGFDTEEEAKVEKFEIFEKTKNFFLTQKEMNIDLKNKDEYADGGEVVDTLYNNLVNYVKEQKYKKHEKYFLETIKMYFKQDRDFKSFPMENENLELNDFMDYVVEMENDEHLKYIIITIEKFKKKYGYTEEDLYAKGGGVDDDLLTHQMFFITDKKGVPLGYDDGYILAFNTDNLLRHQEDWEGEVSDFDVVSEKLLLNNNYDIDNVNGTIYYDATKDEKIVFGEELKEPYRSFYLKQIKENSFANGGGVGKERFNLSFNYNPSNLSNEDAEKIVEQYTKDWKHDNDWDNVSFYVFNLTKEKADELKAELKMEDTFNIEIEKSRNSFAKGGGVEGKSKKDRIIDYYYENYVIKNPKDFRLTKKDLKDKEKVFDAIIKYYNLDNAKSVREQFEFIFEDEDLVKDKKSSEKEYNIQVWETQEDREYGESFIAEILSNKKEAISRAEKMYYHNNYKAIEVVDENGETLFHLSSDDDDDDYAKGGGVSAKRSETKNIKKYVVKGNVYDGGEVLEQTFDNIDEAFDLASEIENGWSDDGTYYLITIYNEKGKKVAEISDDKYFNELTENKLFNKFDLSADTKKTRQIENEKLNGYKFNLKVLIANGGETGIFEKTFDSIFDVMDKMNKYYEEKYYSLINGKDLEYWDEEYSIINASRNFIKGKYGWSFVKENNYWIAKDEYENNHIVKIVNGKPSSNYYITKGALKQIMELEVQKKYSEKPKHNKSLSDMKKIWDKLSKNYKEREDIAFLINLSGGLLSHIVPYKWDDIKKATQIKIMNAYFGQTEEQKQKIINETRKYHEAFVKKHKNLKNMYSNKYYDGGGVDDEDWIEESLINLQDKVNDDNLIVDNSDYTSYTATNGSDEYLVFKTEDNAREVAIERVKEDLTENPQYFNKSWLSEYVDGESFFTDMYNEWNNGYVNDIESEDSDKYANRLIEEMVDNGIISREEAKEDDFDAEYYKNDYAELLTSNQIDEGNGGLDYYISNFGEEEAFKVVLNNNLINVEDASENAIDTDGIAHFISSYDGKQINLSNGHVAYRIN